MREVISIALETNGKGYLGFLCDLPGAFVRGKTKNQALAKVGYEATIYQKWLGIKHNISYETNVVQIYESKFMIEDADSEILLNVDKEKMPKYEFKKYISLIRKSGLSVLNIYNNTEFIDWVDEDRVKNTFYGYKPKSIQEIYDHMDSVQYYYLSRICSNIEERTGFLDRREYCLNKISKMYNVENNFCIYNVDNELWTIKKVLRRFIWHDRIHAKSMIRILQKQKQMGLITDYKDPFLFFGS